MTATGKTSQIVAIAVAIIVVSGAGAVRELGFFDGSVRGGLIGGAILTAIVTFALLVSRILAAHPGKIGEAQFDTLNEDRAN